MPNPVPTRPKTAAGAPPETDAPPAGGAYRTSQLTAHLPALIEAVLLADIERPEKVQAALAGVFRAVEQHFADGGSFEDLEHILSSVPELTDPLGPLGPLWIATQIELGRPLRTPEIHREVANDVLHALKTAGVMRYIGAPSAS